MKNIIIFLLIIGLTLKASNDKIEIVRKNLKTASTMSQGIGLYKFSKALIRFPLFLSLQKSPSLAASVVVGKRQMSALKHGLSGLAWLVLSFTLDMGKSILDLHQISNKLK